MSFDSLRSLRVEYLPGALNLAVEPHVLQHRLVVLLGGVLDEVVEEALGFGEVGGVAGRRPEQVAHLCGIAGPSRLFQCCFCSLVRLSGTYLTDFRPAGLPRFGLVCQRGD